MSLEKNKAIKQIQSLITQLEQLKKKLNNNASSNVFLSWQRTTQQTIINLFGKDSAHAKQFVHIKFEPQTGNGVVSKTDKRIAYYEGLDNAHAILNSILKEVQEQWTNEEPIGARHAFWWLRVILALICAGVGYGRFFLPQVQSWKWLQEHPNKLGLYLGIIIITTSLIWALLDSKRWKLVLVSVTFGTYS